MDFKFFHTLDKDLENAFVDQLRIGVKASGDQLEVARPNLEWMPPTIDGDVAVFWGVSKESRQIVDLYKAAGKRTLIFDKGAIRTRNRSEHNKVFLDGGTALAYLMRKRRPEDRWRKLGIGMKPWRRSGSSLVFANDSQKVHDYWRLGSADALAEDTISKLRRIAPGRRIIFRPKPRALDFREIDGIELSLRPDTIEDALVDAQCLITFTSHCSVNALLEGVPVVALSPNPARPLAGKYFEQVLNPYRPDDEKRYQFFCNLAYAQWTDEEIRSGAALAFLKTEIAATKVQIDEPVKPRTE